MTAVDLRAAREQAGLIERTGYEPAEDAFYESLFALSNGHLGVRATVDFDAGGGWPGFFHTDLYGPGLTVARELVNGINPTFREILVDGAPLRITRDSVVGFRQILDVVNAENCLEALVRDVEGTSLRLAVTTLLPAPWNDLVLTRLTVEPLDRDCQVVVNVGFDWGAGNRDHGGVFERVRLHHLDVVDRSYQPARLAVTADNAGCGQRLVAAAAVLSSPARRGSAASRTRFAEANRFQAPRRQVLTVDVVSVVDVVDAGGTPAEVAGRLETALAGGVSALVSRHRSVWARRRRGAAEVVGCPPLLEGLRYSWFQLAQSVDRDRPVVSVPARGLTSEYHSGHCFVNTELFLVPYFAWTEPEVARALLRYRLAGLGGARDHAAATGSRGARFPSEAGPDGRSAAPVRVRDVFTGRDWLERSGSEQAHVSALVLHALDTYLEATGDEDFLRAECASLIAEVAQHLADLLRPDPRADGRGALGVTGLNEYHHGVDHHFTTNVMAQWALHWAADLMQRWGEDVPHRQPPAIVDAAEIAGWRRVAAEVHVPAPRGGVYPPFQGYFDLPDRIREDRGPGHLPALPADGGGRDRLTKQTDVLVAMTSLPDRFDRRALAVNLAYHEPRTVHGSSLSPAHAAIAACWTGDGALADRLLAASARYNLDYEPRADYRNGVHLPACAGAWLILLRGWLGVRGHGGVLRFDPAAPAEHPPLRLPLRWHGQSLVARLDSGGLELVADDGNEGRIEVAAGTRTATLAPGQRWRPGEVTDA